MTKLRIGVPWKDELSFVEYGTATVQPFEWQRSTVFLHGVAHRTMALAATMLGTSGRSEGDVLRQIQEKSIEEVMVSRKANSVLSSTMAFPMDGPTDSSFIERRPRQEMSAAEAAASYREYLGQSMGGMGGSTNGMSDTQLQEDYNEMRERCLLLTQRLMEMEQVAHRLEAQRDEILNRKEKTVQLQTVIADCSVNLENLDRIFNVEDKETQDDAATGMPVLLQPVHLSRAPPCPS